MSDLPPDDADFFDHYDDFDGECWQCGGEGYTYDCIDGCCVDAESGCDLCARRCDVCNSKKPPITSPETSTITTDTIKNSIAGERT